MDGISTLRNKNEIGKRSIRRQIVPSKCEKACILMDDIAVVIDQV